MKGSEILRVQTKEGYILEVRHGEMLWEVKRKVWLDDDDDDDDNDFFFFLVSVRIRLIKEYDSPFDHKKLVYIENYVYQLTCIRL